MNYDISEIKKDPVCSLITFYILGHVACSSELFLNVISKGLNLVSVGSGSDDKDTALKLADRIRELTGIA